MTSAPKKAPTSSAPDASRSSPLHLGLEFSFTQSDYKLILQKSVPAQIRQRVIDIDNNKGEVGGFVRELTFAERPYKHSL